MTTITFPVGPLECNCTILGDDDSRTAWVIDPGAEIATILGHLSAHGWQLLGILITHGHIDHVGGAAALRQQTGAPIWMHPDDHMQLDMLSEQAHWVGMPPPPPTRPDADLTEAARLQLGMTRAQVIETPGHTQGSVCLYLPDEGTLFAGDTLFAGSVGRTDLPGGDWDTLQRSIRSSLLTLPDPIVVIPGHGPETTIGTERATNPYLKD